MNKQLKYLYTADLGKHKYSTERTLGNKTYWQRNDGKHKIQK